MIITNSLLISSDDVALKIEAAANVDELAEEAYDKVMAAPVIDVEVQ